MEFNKGARSIHDLSEDADQDDVVQAVRLKWKVGGIGLDAESLAPACCEAPSGLDNHFTLDVETYKAAPWTDPLRSVHGIVSSARPNLENVPALLKHERSDDAVGTCKEAPYRRVEYTGV